MCPDRLNNEEWTAQITFADTDHIFDTENLKIAPSAVLLVLTAYTVKGEIVWAWKGARIGRRRA